uniref:Transmembrane protein 47 n=1 Tax=Elaeophora elaphi TaxID=1147741 RepID=A0A0R3RFQ6_9BILA
MGTNSSAFLLFHQIFHSCFMAYKCQRSISPGNCHQFLKLFRMEINVFFDSSTANVILSYIKLVAAFLITAAVLTFFAFFLNVFGLRAQDLHRKYVFYKFATYLSLLGVFLELVSLIVFPVCFYVEMKNFGYRNWEFDWSYGVAWGATLFAFGASLLLICDKEHEEVYFKEKTIYNPPPELK